MEDREPAGGAVGREQWSSRVGFILAAVGSAVGLGNVWRFPYITGKYGGAAFVLVYLLAVVLLGIPLMLTEFALGRNTQRNATGALRKLAPGTPWWLLGMSSVTVGVLVLSFYASVTGWTLAYVVRSVAGTYSGLTPEQVGAAFGRFLNSSAEVIFWQFLVMVLTVYVVAKGVKSGIETACKYMMPALVIMELALVVRSLTLPGAAKGLEFYLKPDFRKLSGAAVLAAVGQCFFSLNVGAGQCLIYGSYLPRGESLLGSSLWIAAGETLVALLAGLIIFPAVFAFGLSPGEGPGLTFVTLPNVFNHMPAGGFFAALFYLFLFFAAFTSTIALLEITVGYVVDEWKWSRAKAALAAGIFIFLLGVPSSLSFGPWEGVKIFFGRNFFEFIDFLVSNLLLPIGGILYSVFAAWVWGVKPALEEINAGTGPKVGAWWTLCSRFVVPIIVFIVMLSGLGII